MLHFVKSVSIPLIFFGGITISSTFLEFKSGRGFGFTISSAILFPIKSPAASTVFRNKFLKVVFAASISVLVSVSNNFCYICRIDFSGMTKIHILRHIFFFLVQQNNVSFLFINNQCQINVVFYLSWTTIFIHKSYDNISKLSIISC